MGLSDQVGNELDEFVTDTLRNNLLGLPLDLPAINMTRARSEGIPPLNNVPQADLRRDQRRPARARTPTGSTSGSTSSTPSRWSTSSRPTAQHPTITGADDRCDRRKRADGRTACIVNPATSRLTTSRRPTPPTS